MILRSHTVTTKLNKPTKMSKGKFGFEGFDINHQATYNFDRSLEPSQWLYVPLSSRSGGGNHDHYEDNDLDNIDYDDHDAPNVVVENAGEEEIGPLDAFMEVIHEEMKATPPNAKEKAEKYRNDEENDPMESFLMAKKDVGLPFLIFHEV